MYSYGTKKGGQPLCRYQKGKQRVAALVEGTVQLLQLG